MLYEVITITSFWYFSFSQNRKEIQLPDIPGFITLKCDFHMHTVFSDGDVWPSIRVHEALRENLDAISLTEHIEYQPHSEDIPHPDRNRAYHLALEEAENHDLLIVPGSEITRQAPIGHSVITSYSIHYTKLYDISMALPETSSGKSMVISSMGSHFTPSISFMIT